MSKRGLSDEQIRRVRAALRAHRDAKHAGSNTSIAAVLGISQPAVSQILSGHTRPSYGRRDRERGVGAHPVDPPEDGARFIVGLRERGLDRRWWTARGAA